jgi:hypothetical protein
MWWAELTPKTFMPEFRNLQMLYDKGEFIDMAKIPT